MGIIGQVAKHVEDGEGMRGRGEGSGDGRREW
jgi:hypothetical protein